MCRKAGFHVDCDLTDKKMQKKVRTTAVADNVSTAIALAFFMNGLRTRSTLNGLRGVACPLAITGTGGHVKSNQVILRVLLDAESQSVVGSIAGIRHKTLPYATAVE
eukprot:1262624-Pyramimonas_sp.AAC.1